MRGGDENNSGSSRLNLRGRESQLIEGTSPAQSSANVITLHSYQRTGGHATAQQLFVEDEEVPREFSNLFETIDNIILSLDRASEFIADDRPINADNQLIIARTYSAELFMSRVLGDSVGLIALKVIGALHMLDVRDELSSRIMVIKSVLTKLHRAPMLDFSKAMDLSDEIESVFGTIRLPGYEELADDLIAAADSI